MDFIPTAYEVIAAIDRYMMLHGQDLDAKVQGALLEVSAKVSPVDKIVATGEVLYAVRADLDAEALTIAGQAIDFATRNGWHGLDIDARGFRMVNALRRQLGEPHPTEGEWPDPATDPAAKPLGNEPPALNYPGPPQ